MGRIAEEKIQEIKDRVDIVEVVAGYLPLKRSGANHQGLCPFHQEKSPSFNVNATRQIFHCFGCGVGGNVFTFVTRMEGISFPEAVKRLGERVGIEVVEEAVTPDEQHRRAVRERLFKINEAAGAYYHRVLLDGAEGAVSRRYLRRRGYDGDAVRAFQLGFAPEAWESLAKHLAGQGYKNDDIQQTGLTRPGKHGRGDYDLFRNRLLFPIHDLQGRHIAFGGRVLDDSLPKYINSPESSVYHKGQILYGLYQARDAMRQTGDALVTEGYFDVLALHRAGFCNAVATCGTALTDDHARLLKRFSEKVLLVFDEDAAGRQATFRAMDALLPSGLSVSVVTLPAGADPDSLLQEQGAEGFQACLDAARPVLEVYIEEQLRVQDASIEGRAKAADEVLTRIRRLPGDLERNLYLKLLAERTGLDEELLLRKAKGGSVKAAPQGRRAAATSQAPSPEPSPQRTAVERAQAFLLRMMLHDAPLRARLRKEPIDDLFVGTAFRTVAGHVLSAEDEAGQLPQDLMSAELDEAAQALLARLLLEELEGWAGDSPQRMIEDCLQTIRQEGRLRRFRDLPRLISAAEQSGDWETQAALLQEHTALLREYPEIKKGFER